MSTLQTVVSRGTAASRPASASVPVGSVYFETDTQLLKRNNGSTWDSMGVALLVGDTGSGGTAGFAPAPGVGDAAAGKFLKADATWAVPAGGGGAGALVLLEQHTASNSATLDFTTAISATYDEYAIEFINLVPVTDNAALWMRVSTNGGSTYDAGANYYNALFSFQEAASATGGGGAAQSQMIINGGYSSSANCNLYGSIKFFNPGGSLFKGIIGNSMARFSAGDAHRVQWVIHGEYDITTAVNAFRFLNSSGNISSGIIRCYGIAKV
jgi:hypothetical protein